LAGCSVHLFQVGSWSLVEVFSQEGDALLGLIMPLTSLLKVFSLGVAVLRHSFPEMAQDNVSSLGKRNGTMLRFFYAMIGAGGWALR